MSQCSFMTHFKLKNPRFVELVENTFDKVLKLMRKIKFVLGFCIFKHLLFYAKSSLILLVLNRKTI